MLNQEVATTNVGHQDVNSGASCISRCVKSLITRYYISESNEFTEKKKLAGSKCRSAFITRRRLTNNYLL